MESLLFSRIGVNFSRVERFLDLERWKMRFGQNVLRMAWKARFVQFSYKAYCFHVLAWILVRQSDFWLWNVEKCDLVKTSSAWPEKHVLYNFHGKPTAFTYCREFQSGRAIFGSGTLKNAIWPKRPPHSLKSTFCTIFIQSLLFSRIGVNFSPAERFWLWNVEKCDLVKTSSAWPEKHVLYNFHTKPTVFTYWREFQFRRAIFGSETLRNAIWSKRPPHGLKSTFCTIFIESLLFSRIGVNFRPLSKFWIWNVKKCDLAKTSSSWPEKHVLYNFHRKPTVFTYWR